MLYASQNVETPFMASMRHSWRLAMCAIYGVWLCAPFMASMRHSWRRATGFVGADLRVRPDVGAYCIRPLHALSLRE